MCIRAQYITHKGGGITLDDQVVALPSERIASCSVVRAELLFGARKSQRVEPNVAAVERLLAPFVSSPFDDEAAGHYSIIRAALERLHGRQP